MGMPQPSAHNPVPVIVPNLGNGVGRQQGWRASRSRQRSSIDLGWGVFDLLMASDFMVEDPDATMANFVQALGMPEPKPRWRQAPERHAYVAWFGRVHPSFVVAPTVIEPQGHRHWDGPGQPDDPFFPEHLAEIARVQGKYRLHKLHCTLFATRRFDELRDKLLRRRVPYRLAPWSEEMPMDRIGSASIPRRCTTPRSTTAAS